MLIELIPDFDPTKPPVQSVNGFWIEDIKGFGMKNCFSGLNSIG